MNFSLVNWRTSPKLRLSLASGVLIALLLLWMSWAQVFMNVRLRANDVYMAPAPISDTITIIAIDGESLNRYGSTPAEWSRAVYADVLGQLVDANPRVVAFDLLFSAEEEEDPIFAEALSELRQNEARTRIVLADAGINNVTASLDSSAVPAVVFTESLPLSDIIAEQADYLGYINTFPDVDSTVRRQTSSVMIGDRVAFSWNVATYLAYLRIPEIAAGQVVTYADDTFYVTAERAIPIDERGLYKHYFYGGVSTAGDTNFPVVSMIDVVDGNFDPALIEDRIVLIGLYNTPGQLDQYLVPSSTEGALMPGVEIQAHAIESIIQNMFPTTMPQLWHAVLIVVLSVGASLLYAFPRWYFKIALLIALLVVWFMVASVVFSLTLIEINLLDTLLAIALPFLASLGIDITVERTQRKQKEFILQSLQRIAEQRLRIDQVAFYILSDVKQITPQSSGFLFLRNNQQIEGFIGYDQQKAIEQDQVSKLVQNYAHLQRRTTEKHQTVFPFIWQNQLSGLLIVKHPQRQRLAQESEKLLQELVDQLAPNIDNMLLYHALERQRHLLETVFIESPAGIAILDQGCRVIQHNARLLALVAPDTENLRGQTLSDVFAKRTNNSDVLKQLRKKLNEYRLFSIDEVKVNDTVVRIEAAPLINENLWVVVVADITAMVDLSNLKTQMLRMAAHDLKNPLTRISGYTQLLNMRGTLGEEENRYLGFVKSATTDMMHIINDILNLERLRSGRINLEPTDLTQLVREVCSSHQPDVIQKSQTFKLDVPKEILEVKADVGQLSQAVTNLVGNAIKYTPDEGTVQVRLYREGDKIHFEVQDNGYGIPKESQANMFAEFFRAKTEATAHIQGTGLGLSLVKSVIEAHGGTIGFTSEESVGSTFFFTLPALNSGDIDE